MCILLEWLKLNKKWKKKCWQSLLVKPWKGKKIVDYNIVVLYSEHLAILMAEVDRGLSC